MKSKQPKTTSNLKATKDGLAARERPKPGAYNEGDDGQEGGDDIDDAPWDAKEGDETASNKQRGNKKNKEDTPASAETIVQKKKKKKKMEEDHTTTADPLKKKKKKLKKKRDREFDTTPLDQAVSNLQSAHAAAELHASLEGNKETVTHKRHKLDSDSMPTTTAALRDATHMGQCSFYREQLRECAHELSPADPPVMPMFFPGSGSSDACHYLNNRCPELLQEHRKSPENEKEFGPQVVRRCSPHRHIPPSSLSTTSPTSLTLNTPAAQSPQQRAGDADSYVAPDVLF